MNKPHHTSASHAFLSVLRANGTDRVFLVPGESYLGILDALVDFPDIDVVTCRHEGGAAFMACADGRLTGRPGVVMVSRGPGATNAAIGVHAAQQDGVPLILVVGQIPKSDLRREGFQEIDYQEMYGSIAKWVFEARDPGQLAEAAFKAVRMATSGTPGPVVIVIPEDIQQQPVAQPAWKATPLIPTQPTASTVDRIRGILMEAERPLIIAGGALATENGRNALADLAEAYNVPVAVSFRHHDIFPNTHRLYAGELGLANPAEQISVFERSDVILALGTRLGDMTSQGYKFPTLPRPSQILIHCWPDDHIVGLNFAPDFGLTCDPVLLAQSLAGCAQHQTARLEWNSLISSIAQQHAAWPDVTAADGVPFVHVVKSLAEQAPDDVAICLDSGTFAAPVYRHFPFAFPQLLMASQCGGMGYATPAAIATQLRRSTSKTVCMVGDGGFLMSGPEMIAAVERKLPILFIIANNNCYGSIRIHQERTYPGRTVGTTLSNPDFVAIAKAFGAQAEHVRQVDQVNAAIARGLAADGPYLIEVATSLTAVLPATQSSSPRTGN